jgi:hypothetical protein
MITATVKAAIKEAIKTHPEYSAERIVGLVFEANPSLVRETAKEIGHSWPKQRKSYRPKSYAPVTPPSAAPKRRFWVQTDQAMAPVVGRGWWRS